MPRRKSSDAPIGRIITKRLEEMERSQPWLARKTNRSICTISFIIKGRLKPSEETLKEISTVLSIDSKILSAALEQGAKTSE